jgi:PKHD-type hydroxylase
MSYNYRRISNNPTERSLVTYPYCFWENVFSDEEIEKICSEMSTSTLDAASIAAEDENDKSVIKPQVVDSVRTSKVSFHHFNNKNQWIFERLNNVIEQMNERWYNFDINGYDQFQYSEYHGTEQGHYTWHTDLIFGTIPTNGYFETRKLSLTLLLNDPEKDFQGGDFQFGHEAKSESVAMKKGTLIMFPSMSLHRVTPVTAGIRKSIVVWVLGPKFK